MSLKFKISIGIESHVRIFSNKKIFSNIKVFNNIANNNISCFEIGVPGILPVLNLFFINKIILLGLFIKTDIYNISFFLRKSYFYPDISKNYQITQNNFCFFKNGYLLIYNNYVNYSYYKLIYIRQIHFEEDTGKIIYKNKKSFLDYNRSGSILLEIVSFHNISNIYESILYIKNLQYILYFLNFSKCIMEEGEFRFDINLSLYELYSFLPNYKIELKNLNSFRFLFDIINYEIKRLIYIYINGGLIFSQTRGYNSLLNSSFLIRNKENFYDYKYHIDPDLFYLLLDKKKIFLFLIKIFNWFYILFFLNSRIRKIFFYFIYFKKIFYLFLILGFYYKIFFYIFNWFFKKNLLLFKNIFFKIIFSFEQILLFFYFYFYKNYVFLEKKFFFFLKKKFLTNNYFYKLLIHNNKNVFNSSYIIYNLNIFIINNLFFLHDYIYNKNLLNNMILFFLNKKIFIDFDLLKINYKNKVFIFREMDEWFKSRN